MTLGQMRVRAAWAQGEDRQLGAAADPATQRLLTVAGALCNNAGPDAEGGVRGSPTEAALYLALQGMGLDPLAARLDQPRVAELPFDSGRKRMSVICRSGGELLVYCKGAPEGLLPLCRRIETGRVELMTPAHRRQVAQAANDMAGQGLRVLAVAARSLGPAAGGRGRPWAGRASGGNTAVNTGVGVDIDIDTDIDADVAALEQDLTFIGLVAMADPPRPEAAAALRQSREAGIRVYMVTGDHRRTAEAVAAELGFSPWGAKVLEGWELEKLTEQQLAAAMTETAIFARVSPEHKLRIVKALKTRGDVVAMTGDGINDAPAVKEAHIGIAMGQTGTDVTQEAADMVLLDDNFATIVNAVAQGRAIYENIRRFVRYLLASNLGEVLVMFLGTLLGLPLPLLPIHILFVNLATDGLPAVALGLEPPAAGVMQKPPRAPDESLFSGSVGRRMLTWGVAIGIITLAVFTWSLWSSGDLAAARTAALASLVVSQMFHVLDCRSEREGRAKSGPGGGHADPKRADRRANPALAAAIIFTLLLLAAVIHWPPLQTPFRTVPLSPISWLVIIGSSGSWPLLLAVVRGIRCKSRAVPIG